MLRCSNLQCDSHEEGQYALSANVVFDEDRNPTENIKKIPPEYFECVYYGDRAEELIQPLIGLGNSQ